jgi:O-methyltransferase involved in polyketide biosynthesis
VSALIGNKKTEDDYYVKNGESPHRSSSSRSMRSSTDSQREKRTRAAALKPAAREIHFVPVDVARDRLDDALASSGHDPRRATTWVWEGGVMYLERAAIEATLRVIEHRSAPKSRLIVAYHSPTTLLRSIGFFLRGIGEPIRSAFTQDELRALLLGCGFKVTEDDDLPAIARKLSPQLARSIRLVRHLRIATADR